MYLSRCARESDMQTRVNIILNLTSPGYMFAFHFPGLHRFHGFPLNLLLVFHSYDKLLSRNGTPQIETTKWILGKNSGFFWENRFPTTTPFYIELSLNGKEK